MKTKWILWAKDAGGEWCVFSGKRIPGGQMIPNWKRQAYRFRNLDSALRAGAKLRDAQPGFDLWQAASADSIRFVSVPIARTTVMIARATAQNQNQTTP